MNVEAPSWLITWMQSINLWDALLFFAAAVATVVFIRKRGWRTIVALARGIIASAQILVAVQDLPDFIERTDKRLDEHTSQLRNSHRTNLRDDVTKSIETAERAVSAAERAVELAEGVHGRLDTIERSVDTLARADAEIRAEIEHKERP